MLAYTVIDDTDSLLSLIYPKFMHILLPVHVLSYNNNCLEDDFVKSKNHQWDKIKNKFMFTLYDIDVETEQYASIRDEGQICTCISRYMRTWDFCHMREM